MSNNVYITILQTIVNNIFDKKIVFVILAVVISMVSYAYCHEFGLNELNTKSKIIGY